MVVAEAWPAAVAVSGLPPLRSRLPVGEGFHAGLVAGELGPVRLAEIVTPAGECVRDADLVRASDEELWQIDVVADGRVLAEQDGNRAELGPTDLVVIDPARPVRFTSTATTSVTMLFPRHLLRLRQDDMSRLSAVRIRGDRGPGALVSSLARGMVRTAEGLPADEAARLGTAVTDLISAALSAQLGEAHSSTDDLLRARVLAFIEARLADRDLTPASIAAAHHISVRWLHKLFEYEPTTVAALIRERRLERCRSDLTGPALGRRTIAAIGARWGFADPAHFSRLFKAAYGHTPAEHRLLHRSPTAVHA